MAAMPKAFKDHAANGLLKSVHAETALCRLKGVQE
jgi:hypothetical protein